MPTIDSFDHQRGVHCGAAALRNVSEYYGWVHSEATCFGIGGGPAFVRYDHRNGSWPTFRATPTWLERAFFERLGIPHSFRSGDDFETAWRNATARVDEDDPVLLFLDPAALPYLPEEPTHLPPHVAVMVGYDDETVLLSDGAMGNRQEVSRSTLADAWAVEGVVSLDNESLVVTRARRTVEGNDAAAAGLRGASTYMLDPRAIDRDARGPAEEGLFALRSYADYLGTVPRASDPIGPLRAARRSIDEHGDRTAFRALYAEALDALAQRTGLPADVADRMAGIGRQWGIVADRLDDILASERPQPALFGEAASVMGDIADREQAVFETIADELGATGPRA